MVIDFADFNKSSAASLESFAMWLINQVYIENLLVELTTEQKNFQI